MYEKEFTTAPTTYIDETGKLKTLLPKTTGIHLDNNPLDNDFDYAWIDSDLMLRPRKGESTKVWYLHNRPYYKNEFWERIIKTPSSDINGSSSSYSKLPFWEAIKTTDGADMRNSEAMVFNPLTLWYDRVRYALPSTNIIIEKQGGRLITKHAKGSPVNNNPLPKRPINTNPVPKKEDKKKSFKIDLRIIGLRPTPGLLTFPKGNGNGLYMIKRNE